MGAARNTHGRGEEYLQDFDGKTLRKETIWKNFMFC
jgi:hypothetical protein